MSRCRLLAVLAVGALAVPGLAACRDLPTVAAYVGSQRLTNDQVEKIVDEFPAAIRDKNSGDVRQFVVSSFVTREVARDLAKENGISVPEADLSAFSGLASQLHLGPDSAFIKLDAEAQAAMEAVRTLGKPQEPTDADKREAFQQLLDEQFVQPGSFEAVKSQIDSPQMRAALGLRPVLSDALKRYQVSINPRYQPLGIPVSFSLGTTQTGQDVRASVNLPLTPAGSPAVRDLPS
jgi:hypothetical protein